MRLARSIQKFSRHLFLCHYVDEDLIYFLQGFLRQRFFEILEIIGIGHYLPYIFSFFRHNHLISDETKITY